MLAFGAPLVLSGLLALPVIWWLLRLTPPKPRAEIFPPLRLLARVIKQDETPAKSPWWLTLLRLGLTALVIIALSKPLLNPQGEAVAGNGPILLMVDNGWAHPDQWQQRLDQARAIIEEARDAGRPLAISFTVAANGASTALDNADSALPLLDATQTIAAIPDRDAALGKLLTALDDTPSAEATLVILSDGLAHGSDTLVTALSDTRFEKIQVFARQGPLLALSGALNGAQALDLTIVGTDIDPAGQTVSAYDERGRLLAQAETITDVKTNDTTARFEDPFELRNDFAVLRIDGQRHAGAVRLLDDSDRRRRVGLVTGISTDVAQPLLSPLFYIRRAIEPFTDIIGGRTGDLAVDIPEIIEQGPAMLVMADIGVIPPATIDDLNTWIDAGGTLVRFAGPRLAALSNNDPFLPVSLRLGERALGGALSWTEPQTVAPFPADSPFADLTPPAEVSVERQVLAVPDERLNERTWAILDDGTPLVTGEARGRGSVVLFHVTAEATWSNLPISGTFVEMLRRIADTSSNTGMSDNRTAFSADGASLAPARILSTDGELSPAAAHVQTLQPTSIETGLTRFENPAGLYGTTDSYFALNAADNPDVLAPLDLSTIGSNVVQLTYPETSQSDLAPWLFAAALVLLMLDTLAMMVINGRFNKFGRSANRAAVTAAGFCAIAAVTMIPDASAQDQSVQDQQIKNQQVNELAAIDFTKTTRIAYVITGQAATDNMTLAGLDGLTRFIASRTALEPGQPVGVDIETDELAFFPLIYFAIDANAAAPSNAAIARLDAYMQNGGTVLFDTRDQLTGTLDGGNTPENTQLRVILRGLNVPPLEPVPADHVLTKSFYILDTFPGRYAGSPLWIEALPQADDNAQRPVRSGDGVSPIIITGNDLAAAWALDEAGRPLAAVNSGDPLQRIYAFRTGVNIMMYMLTGNYKADQVHIPALLERLGQ